MHIYAEYKSKIWYDRLAYLVNQIIEKPPHEIAGFLAFVEEKDPDWRAREIAREKGESEEVQRELKNRQLTSEGWHV